MRISLFDAHSGHLYGQILCQENAHMAFIRDGTALAYYVPDIGLRTWEIADLIAERLHFTDGHELMLQGVMNNPMSLFEGTKADFLYGYTCTLG